MIKEMSKVQILGPKVLIDDSIRALHAMSVMHIESAGALGDLDESFLTRLPLEAEKLGEQERLNVALEELRNLYALLERPARIYPVRVGREMIDALSLEATPIGERIKGLHAKRDSLKEELSGITRYERILRGFVSLVPKLSGLKNFDILGLTIDKERADVMRLLEEEVARITGGKYEFYVKDLDAETLGILLAYHKRFSSSVTALTCGEAISEIRLPSGYDEMPLLDVIKQMTVRKEELPGLIEEVNREVRSLSAQWYARVEALIKAVQEALDEIGVLAYCRQSRFSFLIEGWVPKELAPRVKEKFLKLFGEKVLFREVEIKDEEMDLIPVYIENPRIIRPFELFLKALPTPRYGSVDPTPYVALFFPTFFGLIVGDIGYGLILLIIGLLARRSLKGRGIYEDGAYIGTLCGLSAILFGFLFGELFGDLGESLSIVHPILLDRMTALKTFLVLTLGIGAGHVTLGIVIAMVNFLARGKRKAAAAKFSFLLLIISSILTALIMKNYLPDGLLKPGLVLLVISSVLVIVLEGILGPLEFIKILGNMVSYVRIMAVGMASVVMAMVANSIGGTTGSLFLGILIGALLHTINIALVILSPTIQAMRLQYVEFLSKFYEGGGRTYRPFKKR